MQRRTLLTAAAGLPGLAALPARAAAWPTRPVRLVVPFAAGGGIDAMSRVMAKVMSPLLGNATIVVENRTGASSRVGSTEVARSAPDGHTLLVTPEVAWVGYFYSGVLGSRFWEELTCVAGFAESPYSLLQVKANAPGASPLETLRAIAQRDGQLSLGGPTAGGLSEFQANDLFRLLKVPGVYVPFNGAAPALSALLSNTVNAIMVPLGDGIVAVRNGITRALAASSHGRFRLAPEVPSFEEEGIGDAAMISYSIWAPPGTPQDICAAIRAALAQTLKDPAFGDALEVHQGYQRKLRSPEQVLADVAAFEKHWGPRFAAAARQAG